VNPDADVLPIQRGDFEGEAEDGGTSSASAQRCGPERSTMKAIFDVDQHVEHVYSLRDGLVCRMEIAPASEAR
jgi:hypothetical protein